MVRKLNPKDWPFATDEEREEREARMNLPLPAEGTLGRRHIYAHLKAEYGCEMPAECIKRGEHRQKIQAILAVGYKCDRRCREGWKLMGYADEQLEELRRHNSKLPKDVTEQWMICREPGTGIYANEPNPKKLYDNLAQATRDAEELSRVQQKRFYLLKVIAYVEPTQPPVPPISWHYADGF